MLKITYKSRALKNVIHYTKRGNCESICRFFKQNESIQIANRNALVLASVNKKLNYWYRFSDI